MTATVMATANIELPDGTKVVIDGSPDEIARILDLYRQTPSSDAGSSASVGKPRKQEAMVRLRQDRASRVRSGAMQHIRSLISEGFFDGRKSISNVQTKLEELGHIYPLTHLSTPLRRLVVGRELRRIRDGKNWTYVNAG